MSESIWRKEIHLRKPKQPEAAERANVEETVSEQSSESLPKGRRIRRRPEPLPPLPRHLLDSRRAPRDTVVVPVVPGRPSAAERFAREFDEWAARAVQHPAEEQPPAETPQDEVPVIDPMPWVFQPEVEPEPEPELELPWEPEPVAAVPEFEFSSVTPPALMELGSAEPFPEVDLAAEPNQVPEFSPPQEKVSLLKREIHFRRPRAEKQPKAAKPPKAEKEPTEKTPLLKRELHLRKPKPEPEELGSNATVPMLELPAEPNQVPELPELHSEPAQELEVEAQPAASVEMVSDASPVSDTPSDSAPAPKEKVPLLKREMHFRKPNVKKAAKSSDDAAHKVTRVVGLRIGSSQISAAHVRNNGSAELVQLARMPIDQGLVVGGEVRDADGLMHALKDFFAKNKLPRKDVRLGIASTRIGVRVLEVPAIDDPKQFQNALRFRAQELLPIPVVDAILDHVVIDSFVGSEGEDMRRVLLVFAHRDLVARFVDVCKGAGVRLAGIDLEPFALLRSVASPRSDSRDAVVAVAVGHDRTIVAVSDGRVCDFVRVLDWGGSALDVAIARALNLAPSQAEPFKHDLALDAIEAPDGVTPVQLELVKAAAKTELASLGRELVSSLRFYQSRPGALAIGEVLLTGGAAQLGGMADELQRHLGAPVRVADPLARVQVPRKFKTPDDAGSFAVAIGLGIED